MPKETIVLGAGVIGLTTALTLQEKNIPVKIVTAKLPAETTSAVAAAIWLPYEVKPFDKVKKWSSISYDIYKSLCSNSGAGVKMVDMTIIIEKEEDAWWKDVLPTDSIREAVPEELPGEHKIGYVLKVPMIETHLHLQYLLDKFKSSGGKLEVRAVQRLAEFNEETTVVNCTGLAAKQLTGDDALYPIQGQIVYLKPDSKLKCIVSEIAEGVNKDQLAYIIPRSDHTVLGGTARVNKDNLEATNEEAKAIIERCLKLDDKIDAGRFVSTQVGLRPGRSEIRLEREKNIIHNYGHGGGGYTVSWGCATSVLDLM